MFNKKQHYKRGPRMNYQIRSDEIELIDEEGQHHTTYKTVDALQRAVDLGLQLVEMKFDRFKPVCKIMDYGKHQYQKSKQENANRKKHKQIKEKEVQISATIAENDLKRLIDKARKMLEEGNKVRVVLSLRGRAILHKEQNMKNMNAFIAGLEDVAKVLKMPAQEGKKSIAILSPLSKVV